MLDWLKNINKEHPEFWKIMSLNLIKNQHALWFYQQKLLE
jgi:SAM-dependent MidA family methyltransferase